MYIIKNFIIPIFPNLSQTKLCPIYHNKQVSTLRLRLGRNLKSLGDTILQSFLLLYAVPFLHEQGRIYRKLARSDCSRHACRLFGKRRRRRKGNRHKEAAEQGGVDTLVHGPLSPWKLWLALSFLIGKLSLRHNKKGKNSISFRGRLNLPENSLYFLPITPDVYPLNSLSVCLILFGYLSSYWDFSGDSVSVDLGRLRWFIWVNCHRRKYKDFGLKG